MVVVIIGFGGDDVLIKIIGSWKIGLGIWSCVGHVGHAAEGTIRAGQ